MGFVPAFSTLRTLRLHGERNGCTFLAFYEHTKQGLPVPCGGMHKIIVKKEHTRTHTYICTYTCIHTYVFIFQRGWMECLENSLKHWIYCRTAGAHFAEYGRTSRKLAFRSEIDSSLNPRLRLCCF